MIEESLKPLHKHEARRTKPRNVATRTLEPMTNVELLVYTRTFAYDHTTSTYRPFSCRTYGRANQLERTTVIGVIMPEPTDLAGEPIVHRMPVEAYFELSEHNQLRSRITELLTGIGKYVHYAATLPELQRIASHLESL